MENYCFNAFSCHGLDVKPQKCVFEVWWRHKPSFTIVWRHTVINFDLKCCCSSSSRKTIVYNCFHHFVLSSNQEIEFLRLLWRHNGVTSPYTKITTGYKQFSTLWLIGNNNKQSNISQKKKRRKIWNSDLSIILLLPIGSLKI